MLADGGSLTTVTNSTFSGNSAVGTEAQVQDGGAIDSGGLLTVTNSTFSGNTATGPGADIDTFLGDGATLRGTILSSSNDSNCNSFDATTITDGGYNISSDASCGFSGTSLPSTNPMLGSLANNGGPTQTMALVPVSPAVDAIPVGPLCPASGTKDQRGTVRPQGSACDIGAYELKAPWIAAVTVDSGLSGSSPSVSGTITCNQGASFAVSVTVTQEKLKAVGASSSAACVGLTPVSWTLSVAPGTFAPGAATVSYTATVGTAKKTGKASLTLT